MPPGEAPALRVVWLSVETGLVRLRDLGQGLASGCGVVPIDATFRDVVGPLARTVSDAAIVLDVIAGPSNRDLASYASVGKTPAKGYVAALSTASLAGKRFGLVGVGWRRNFLPLARARWTSP